MKLSNEFHEFRFGVSKVYLSIILWFIDGEILSEEYLRLIETLHFRLFIQSKIPNLLTEIRLLTGNRVTSI